MTDAELEEIQARSSAITECDIEHVYADRRKLLAYVDKLRAKPDLMAVCEKAYAILSLVTPSLLKRPDHPLWEAAGVLGNAIAKKPPYSPTPPATSECGCPICSERSAPK